MHSSPRSGAPGKGALLVLALLTPLGGCCTLARLWCGPDRSRWVPISFRTPADALATFQEAIRRDRPLEIYRCLSENLKRRLGVAGPVEAAVAWKRITEEAPGVILLGTALASEPRSLGADRVRFVLSAAGHRVRVDLVRQAFLSFRYLENGDVIPAGRYVDHLRAYVGVSGGRVTLRAPGDLELPEDLSLERLEEVSAGYEWKVDAIAEDRDEAKAATGASFQASVAALAAPLHPPRPFTARPASRRR